MITDKFHIETVEGINCAVPDGYTLIKKKGNIVLPRDKRLNLCSLITKYKGENLLEFDLFGGEDGALIKVQIGSHRDISVYGWPYDGK
jgi:hypothetical protein